MAKLPRLLVVDDMDSVRALVAAKPFRFQQMEIESTVSIGGTMLVASESPDVGLLLKRADEKFVTEAAFDNPKFVEDTVRDLAVRLDKDERIIKYRITSENYESIHSHNAYASLTRDKR